MAFSMNVSEDIKDTDDIDYDSIEAAYDEELDGEQGLQQEQAPQTTPPAEAPQNEQGQEVQA